MELIQFENFSSSNSDFWQARSRDQGYRGSRITDNSHLSAYRIAGNRETSIPSDSWRKSLNLESKFLTNGLDRYC